MSRQWTRYPRKRLFLEELETREVLNASFPVTNNGIYLLSDQLSDLQDYSTQLTHFIATHFVGTEKLTADQNAPFVAVNPNWVLLNYRLATSSGPVEYILNNGQWGSDWSMVNSNEDWFMHNPTDGTRDYNSTFNWYLNDISNPAFDQYFVNSTIQSMQATGAVALMADSFEAGVGGFWFTESDPRFAGTNAGNPADWPNGDTWLNQMQAYVSYVQQQFAATPQQFLFIPNVGSLDTSWETFDYNQLDGGFLEDFGMQGPGYLNSNTSDWILGMNRALPMSAAGKVLIMQPYLENAPNSTLGLEQRGYDLGTYLLLQGNHTYLNVGGGGGSPTDAFYYPEDTINIGAPLSPTATNVSQYAWDGVYRRDFQNGIVLVNPTSSTVTISLPQNYQLASFNGGGALTNTSLDANGNYIGGSVQYTTVNSVTLTPSTGAILLNSTTSSITQPNDPGFELPNVGNSYLVDPSGSPWTFTGSAGVAGNAGPVTSGNPNAPQGTQVAWAQNGGSISQEVNFAAGSFTISLEAAQRGNYPSNSTIQVEIDGQTVGSITPTSTSYAAFTTNSFAVTAGSHTVQFVGVSNLGGSTALFDQVNIQSTNSSPPPAPPPSPPPSSITQPSDPGFELPNVGNGYAIDPTGSPWTFTGSAGVAGNAGPVTSGNPNAPQGTQVAWEQNGGSISQAVNFAAGSFTISFEAAQRGNYPSNTTIQVEIDGQTVATVTPSGTSYTAFTTSSFMVTAGSHTIQFVGVSNSGGSTALIDQVSIAASP
jgi:hypothetical protein